MTGNSERRLSVHPASDPGSGPDRSTRPKPQAGREGLHLFGRIAPAATEAIASGPCWSVTGLATARRPAIRIETARLILRPHDEIDFPAFYEMMRDPGTFRYASRGPMGEEDAWHRMLRHVGHWVIKGWGLFAVEEKESGLLVGEAGINHFRRGFAEDLEGTPEALWTTARWAQRRGYATEAMRAALGWAERALGVDRTFCIIHRDNRPSLRVAAKLGYAAIRETEHFGATCLLMQRDDWQQARLISGQRASC